MSALDNFTPTTPSELMLWKELQRTKVQLQLALRDVSDPQAVFATMEPPVTMVMDSLPPRIELIPEARLIANITDEGRMRVQVTGMFRDDPRQIGVAYYADVRPHTMMEAANVMSILHKDQLHKLANFGWKGVKR